MLRFVLRPNAFKEIRNKVLIWSTPVYLMMLAGLFWIFSGVDQSAITYVLMMVMLGVFIFSTFNSLRRQKKIYESFVLTVESEGLLREQFNTPPLRILKSEVTSIVRAPDGAISITGASRLNPLIIPAQVEDRDNLEMLLSAIKPIEQRTSNKRTILLVLGGMFGFFGLGALFFSVDNKLVAGTSGILLLLILIGCCIITFRSKLVERRIRWMGLIGILPVLALSGMVYVKIFPPETTSTSIRSSFFASSFTVYFLEDGQAMSSEEFSQFIIQQLPSFQPVDSLPVSIVNDIYYINAPEDIRDDYAPGSPDYLEMAGIGLTSEEVAKLQTATKGIYVEFLGPADSLQQKHRAIASLFTKLSQQENVIILDENDRLYFNANSWKRKRVAELVPSPLNVPSQINVHVYREGEYCRAVTLGMDKFALPDISIKDFPCSDQDLIGKMINALAQTISENPFISKDSLITLDLAKIANDSVRIYLTRSNIPALPVVLRLKSVSPQEGDAFNDQ